MAILAIKGHATRGREVIGLLEMLGGQNRKGFKGTVEYGYYGIEEDYEIFGDYFIRGSVVFTLEEFLEKFPYKIGDEVVTREGEHCKITSMQFDGEREEVMYGLSDHDMLIFFSDIVATPTPNKNKKLWKKRKKLL